MNGSYDHESPVDRMRAIEQALAMYSRARVGQTAQREGLPTGQTRVDEGAVPSPYASPMMGMDEARARIAAYQTFIDRVLEEDMLRQSEETYLKGTAEADVTVPGHDAQGDTR